MSTTEPPEADLLLPPHNCLPPALVYENGQSTSGQRIRPLFLQESPRDAAHF
jgi:hypothetical protein